jgi:hypothetical protein
MVSFNSKKALQDAIKKQIISNDAQSIKAMMKINVLYNSKSIVN